MKQDSAEDQLNKFLLLSQPFAKSELLKNKFREINAKAMDRFENESQSNNPELFERFKRGLTSDLFKIYSRCKSDNETKKKHYLDNRPEKGSQLEEQILSIYLSYGTIFGSIFDNKFDNWFHTLTPNCIAIDDSGDIMVGKWAKEFLNNCEELDIKKLFVSKVERLVSKRVGFVSI